MSTNQQVPSDIEAIITAKVQSVRAEEAAKAEAERQENESFLAKGKAIYEEFIQGNLAGVPEFMRPYLDMSVADEPNFERLGRSWDNLYYTRLYFSIPGLSLIALHPKGKTWMCQVAHPSSQDWTGDDYEWIEPSISFPRNDNWNADLEFVLARAKREKQNLLQYIAEYAAAEEERAKELAQSKAEQQSRNEHSQRLIEEREAERQATAQKEQAEEQALFNAVKDDPVAMNLLKAFALLRDERSSFSQQLENADWALYNIEERHSRHAAELRRQADEADRRAEDERRRLQDDLDDAEAKLKKAERGW
jgi:hypothetical protein